MCLGLPLHTPSIHPSAHMALVGMTGTDREFPNMDKGKQAVTPIIEQLSVCAGGNEGNDIGVYLHKEGRGGGVRGR